MLKLNIQEILTKYLLHVEESIVGNLNISETNCSEKGLQTAFTAILQYSNPAPFKFNVHMNHLGNLVKV